MLNEMSICNVEKIMERYIYIWLNNVYLNISKINDELNFVSAIIDSFKK